MPGVDDVEVKQSTIPGAGNGLFAKKAFAPGDVVLALARPYIAELDIDRLGDSCAWCCSRAENDPEERFKSQQMGLPTGFLEVKACTGCKKIKYCSKACQAKAWKMEHKHECKILAPPDRPPLPHVVRATVRLLKQIEAGDEAPKAILRFDSKIEEIRKTDPKSYEEFSTLAFGAWNFAGKPSKADLDVARHLFFAVNCNSLAFSSPLDAVKIGIGFDPILCTANHSCDPNVFLVFNCPRTLLRAKRPIAKGEEIFKSYRDHTNPFSVRQADLKDGYFFDCTCSKCAKGPCLQEDAFTKPIDNLPQDWISKADDLIRKQEAEKVDTSWYTVENNSTEAARRMTALQAEAFKPWAAMKSIESQFHGGKVPKIDVPDLEKALRVCLDSGMWSLTRQPVPFILRDLFGGYMTHGDINRCLHVGLKKYFCVDEIVRPQFDHDRVFETWSLMQVVTIYSHPSKQAEASELARKGCDTRILFLGLLVEIWEGLPKSYGRMESPIGQVVMTVWKTCVGEDTEVPQELRRQKEAAWPKLKAYAEGIDLLKM
ncbi:SET domain-containing protein [Hortaea werneckii]|nr:SET domain-containing protein [Hortaea werneckii]